MISLIAAIGNNRAIGFKQDMPWTLPRDLAYFKKVTSGHTIVMGRKTFESIGRPLPNRKNLVLTRQKDFHFPEGVRLISSLDEVLRPDKNRPSEEIFIIGGGELYKQALPYADRLYITQINENFEGDTFFPSFSEEDWEIISKTPGIRDERNPYDYKFLIYERRKL